MDEIEKRSLNILLPYSRDSRTEYLNTQEYPFWSPNSSLDPTIKTEINVTQWLITQK